MWGRRRRVYQTAADMVYSRHRTRTGFSGTRPFEQVGVTAMFEVSPRGRSLKAQPSLPTL